MDLAIANDVHEKEQQLQATAARLRIHSILLVSALAIVLLLAVLLWRNRYYMYTIRRKNMAMVDTVAGLLAYKERLLHVGGQTEEGTGCVPAPVTGDSGAVDGSDGDDRKAMRLFEQLDRKINEQRLFLNPGLSREDLMRLINISRNQIAQVIQAGAGTNLAGYLNGLRMEYAARLLIRYPEYTVNAIAQEAGIPNLSSFHRLFKNRYGMTPSEFRKAQCG